MTPQSSRLATLVIAFLLMLILVACNRSANRAQTRPEEGGHAMKQMTLKSTAFGHNETIPRKHTEDGQNASPPLTWSDVPANTHELALIVDDPDAPRKDPWVHWVLYRIPPETRELPEGVPPSQRIAKPGGAVQGKNSWDRIGWGGPAPPKNHGLHHYHFRLYALDMKLNLEPGATKETLLEAMHGHIIAEGEIVGTYQR